LLCKSTGAIFLGAVAILALMPGFRRWLLLALILGVPAYLCTRLFGGGFVEGAITDAASLVSEDRAGSLQFRFDSEAQLLAKLWANPWFGSGGWTFGDVRDLETDEVSSVVVDSYWIIAAATRGLLGLLGAVGMLWLPTFRILGCAGGLPAWRSPERLAACALLTILILDCLVNSFVSPIYIFLAGGLSQLPLRESLNPHAGGNMSAIARPPICIGRGPLTSRSPVAPNERSQRPMTPLRPRHHTHGS